MDDQGIGALYEGIVDWFDQNRTKILYEKPYLDMAMQHCASNPTVLDLGCGSGEPIARFFIEQGCRVTGVDGSAGMIALCTERFPESEWIQADMRYVQFQRTFDVVIAWDSFFHLTHEAQRSMFPVFDAFTLAGSILLFTSGVDYGVAYGEMDGRVVYHASLDTAEYQTLLTQHGFEVLKHTINDVACGGHNVWLAKKVRAKSITD